MNIKKLCENTLTKEDAINIKELDNMINNIESQVKKYKQDLIEEYTGSHSKEELKSICDSNEKHMKLLEEYYSCNRSYSDLIIDGLIISIVPGIGAVISNTLLVKGVCGLCVFAGIGMIIWGIRRWKIKKMIELNFKDIDLGI